MAAITLSTLTVLGGRGQLVRRDDTMKNQTIIITTSIVAFFLTLVIIIFLLASKINRKPDPKERSGPGPFRCLFPCCLPDPLSPREMKKRRRWWLYTGPPDNYQYSHQTAKVWPDNYSTRAIPAVVDDNTMNTLVVVDADAPNPHEPQGPEWMAALPFNQSPALAYTLRVPAALPPIHARVETINSSSD